MIGKVAVFALFRPEFFSVQHCEPNRVDMNWSESRTPSNCTVDLTDNHEEVFDPTRLPLCESRLFYAKVCGLLSVFFITQQG